ncbi:hypothetical protein NAEGRDRAFT_78144 [Naegleria gruberi]|uniref:Uncharacterized protein n=1 Tax=Naegleria gruberi TaxID=5762 RepID=D2V1I6_NAEGR|nr:uncharacterized protein NAEGRDRAFT_78144 [Naegleria gruberi]EFC49315.1 hypothetical protein NAEGRDRAFT_78144 [Naegleria gruberi]|eukprot:XP_002682059.1 hypothetical protein NAEGRDRAFT_78144 [Naegleria gruberi strain NEG-M]
MSLHLIKCFDGELTIRRKTDSHPDFWNALERDEYFINCSKDVLQVLSYWIVYGKYISDMNHSKLGLKCVAEYFGLELLIVDVDLDNHNFEKVSVVSKGSRKSANLQGNKQKKAKPNERLTSMMDEVSDHVMIEGGNSTNVADSDSTSVSSEPISNETSSQPERKLTNQEKAKLKLQKQQQATLEKQATRRAQKEAASSSRTVANASSSNDNTPMHQVSNEMHDEDMQCMLGSKLVTLNIEKMKESGSALFSQVADPSEGFTVKVNKRGIPVIFDAVPEEYVKPIVDFINTGIVPSSILSKPASFKFGLAEIANVLSLQSIYSQLPGLFIDFCTILEPEEQLVLGSFIAKKNMPFLKTGTWNLGCSITSPLTTPKSLIYFFTQNPTLVIIQTNDEKKYGALLCAYVKSKGTPQHYKYDFIFDILFDEFQIHTIKNPISCPHKLYSQNADEVIDLGGISVLRNPTTNNLYATMNNGAFNIPDDQLTDFEVKKIEVFTFY